MYIFIGNKAAGAGVVASVMGHTLVNVSNAYKTAALVRDDATTEEMWKLFSNFYVSVDQENPLIEQLRTVIRKGVRDAIIVDCLNEDMLQLIKAQIHCIVIGVGDVSWGLDECDHVVENVGSLPELFPEWELVHSIAKGIDKNRPMQAASLLLTAASPELAVKTWKECFVKACAKETKAQQKKEDGWTSPIADLWEN